MQINKSYFTKIKSFIFKAQLKEDISQKQFDKSDQNIDDLTRKFKTLMLIINALLKKIIQKKQFEYSLMKCLKEVSMSFFSRSYFNDCFECDVTDYLLRYCLKVQFLCNKEIVHIYENEKVC